MHNFDTGLNNELESRFGNLRLGEVKNISGCIPAAVARQITEGNPDYLEIFDSRKRWQENLLVKDILRATTNAPTYFETPIKIGNQDYVDGGVSGNCPLEVAIPRVMTIFEDYDPELQTVISIAPPAPWQSKKAKSTFAKFLDWIGSKLGFKQAFTFKHISYFSNVVFSGFASFVECSDRYPLATFIRASPVSDQSAKFEMDETDIEAMEASINYERLNDQRYYTKIMDMATLLVTSDSKLPVTRNETFDQTIINVLDNMVGRIKKIRTKREHKQSGHFQRLVTVCLKIVRNMLRKTEGTQGIIDFEPIFLVCIFMTYKLY